MFRFILPALLLVCASAGPAQLRSRAADPLAAVNPVLSAEQARADLAFAQRSLEEAHGGIDRYVPRGRVQQAFAAARARITRPMTMLEVYRLLAPALFSVKDGHLSLYLPEEAERSLRTGVPLLPLRIRFIGARPFVATDLLTPDGRLTGHELRSVNGIPAQHIVRRLLETTRGDGDIVTARLRRNEGFTFSEQLVAMIGTGAPYRAELFDPLRQRSVPIASAGTPLPALQRRWLTAFPQQQPPAESTDFALLDGGRTARLTIRDFGWFSGADRKVEVQQVIADAFQEMKTRGTEALVLDLRGNSGGADELGRILLTYLVDAPFEYYSDLKANALKFSFAPQVTAGARELDATRFKPRPQGGFLFTGHPNWGEWQPAETRFDGPLYVLIDGGSFSTTSELLSHLHSRQRATFIGEEAGGGYYGNSSGYMSIITLPHSRLRIRMPLITYTLAVAPGHARPRGVLPNHRVVPTPDDLRTGKDRALELALSLARDRARAQR